MAVLQKKYFNNLTIEEQVQYINKLLMEGNTITAACKNIGIARSTISGRFTKNDYTYNEELHKYYKSNTHIKIEPKEPIIKGENKNNTKVLHSKLIGKEEEILEMLEWYKSQNNKPKKIVINNRFKGEVKNHSFKCDDDIYIKYIEVLKSYDMYKKQDLNSLALLEFIEKYKKE